MTRGMLNFYSAQRPHLRQDFPNSVQIFLEENYRSTGAILASSLAIVSQGTLNGFIRIYFSWYCEDPNRIDKNLKTTNNQGHLPVLKEFPSGPSEASGVALEIKRLIAYTGGLLKYKDFAILR